MAYDFDGVNDAIHWDGVVPNQLTEITVSAWVYADNITQDHVVAATRTSGVADEGFLFWHDDVAFISSRTDTFSILIQEAVSGDEARIEGANGAAKANQWQHVLIAFKANVAGGLELWVDGVEDANSPVTTSGVSDIGRANNLWVGTHPAAGFDRNGRTAEVAVWGRVLPDSVKIALSKRASPRLFPDNLRSAPPMIRSLHDPISGVVGTLVNNAVPIAHPPIIMPTPAQTAFIAAAVAAQTVGTGLLSGLKLGRPRLVA